MIFKNTFSPKEIAVFLRQNKDISIDKIGEYIGGHDSLNIKVLSEFTDLLNFSEKGVVQALRYYLEQYTLPGEA